MTPLDRLAYEKYTDGAAFVLSWDDLAEDLKKHYREGARADMQAERMRLEDRQRSDQKRIDEIGDSLGDGLRWASMGPGWTLLPYGCTVGVALLCPPTDARGWSSMVISPFLEKTGARFEVVAFLREHYKGRYFPEPPEAS